MKKLILLILLIPVTLLGQLQKKITVQDGNFEILLPGEPSKQVEGDYTTLTSKDGKIAFQVVYINREADLTGHEELLISNSFEMYGTIQGEVEKRTVEGMTARYAEVKLDNLLFYVLVIQGDMRQWTLACVKQGGTVNPKLRKEYFDSFSLLSGGSVQNTSSTSNNTQSSTTSSNTDQSLKGYIKSNTHYLVDIDYLSKQHAWADEERMYDMLQLDLPEFRSKVLNNKSQVLTFGYDGKRSVEFAEQIDQLEPVAPSVLESYINMAKERMNRTFYGTSPLSLLSSTIELSEDFMELFPENEEIKKQHKIAKDEFESLTKSATYITGDFHLEHLDELVLFENKTKPGNENPEEIAQIIKPGAGTHLIAYFSSNLLSSKNTVHLNITVNSQVMQVQKIFYWEKDIKEVLKNSGTVSYTIFPNPDELDYTSPYQFDQHLNVLEYLLQQPEGVYNIEVVAELGRNQNMRGQKSIAKEYKIDLTTASKQEIKMLYSELMAMRIETIKMPKCTDNTSLIGNKEGFEKYGKFLKYTQTEPVGEVRDQSKIGKPVIGKTTGGWAAIQREDGTVELIKIGLSMPNGQSYWKFTSLGVLPSDYQMSGSTYINAAKGEFGYQILMENVKTCSQWE